MAQEAIVFDWSPGAQMVKELMSDPAVRVEVVAKTAEVLAHAKAAAADHVVTGTYLASLSSKMGRGFDLRPVGVVQSSDKKATLVEVGTARSAGQFILRGALAKAELKVGRGD